MVVSPKLGDPQYRPQNTILLNIGTPKRVPLILGNPPYEVKLISLRAQAWDVPLRDPARVLGLGFTA